MKIENMPTRELRRSLIATERAYGVNSVGAVALRRELERRTVERAKKRAARKGASNGE